LGLPSDLFPSGFPIETVYMPLTSPIQATCPAHLILLSFINRTVVGEDKMSVRWHFYCTWTTRRNVKEYNAWRYYTKVYGHNVVVYL
jgi:hypothetical protein